MPRIRTIKPEFWNDQKLGMESEAVMLVCIALWNLSDDYGTVNGNQMWLKNQIFPYKDKLRIDVFSTWLARLVELEVIIPFTFKGGSFYYIRTFRKHQRVDRPSQARNCDEGNLIRILREKGYEIQEDGAFIKDSTSTLRGIDEGSSQEIVIGREKEIGKEEEGNAPAGDFAQPLLLEPKELYKYLVKDKNTVHDFLKTHKPDFIDPYVDYWNLFATEKGFAKVEAISDSRRKKFKVRIKEPTFNFCAILFKAGKSEFICTEGNWFTFDWVLENDKNYLKVLEGNYDNKKNEPPNGQSQYSEEYKRQRKELEERTRRLSSQ